MGGSAAQRARRLLSRAGRWPTSAPHVLVLRTGSLSAGALRALHGSQITHVRSASATGSGPEPLQGAEAHAGELTESGLMMRTDAEGAISLVPPDEPLPDARTYRNLDGHRVDDGRYAAFAADVSSLLPSQRIITDPLRTFAYGTDASAYRLTPAMVLKVSSEAEVASLLPLA
ncbi:hypothetical protein H632_c4119p0, partial [Helicosporidium sp. ATCC 50920]